MKYRCIAQLQEKADGVSLCRGLGVSRSGYYGARSRAAKPKGACRTTVHLKAAFEASGRAYGSRRLKAALTNQGVVMGRHRVRTLRWSAPGISVHWLIEDNRPVEAL